MPSTEPDLTDFCCSDAPDPFSTKTLQVAVGVVKNAKGQVLISLRNQALHQGGLWEFPGGKIEPGEMIGQALARELKEELNITVLTSMPLIKISHRYPDRAVSLHVHSVDCYEGIARHAHGQPLRWVDPKELTSYSFPAANRPIVTAAQLPSRYAILDDTDEGLILKRLENMLAKGIRLFQARWKRLPLKRMVGLLIEAHRLCRPRQAILLVNSAMLDNKAFPITGASLARERHLQADGIHLTSRHLMAMRERPTSFHWVAASCHSLEEMRHAEAIGIDFIVLGSVLPTRSHPNIEPLGWQQFAEWTRRINIPVYALGGMTETTLPIAQHYGGQGIAGIGAFLD